MITYCTKSKRIKEFKFGVWNIIIYSIPTPSSSKNEDFKILIENPNSDDEMEIHKDRVLVYNHSDDTLHEVL